MAKKLVIAEKPSVAGDIARALGDFQKLDGYFERDDYIVASAVGHLLEIVAPEGVEVKRGKWSFANLPVIPPYFDLKSIPKTETKLKLLLKLIKRKDVKGLINACDAGREGELIFRYIVQYAKTKKPIERVWLQSLTPQSIREGFGELRSDNQMLALADAARCRSEADWLVGINSTRVLTAFNAKTGGFQLTPAGRVQTPTLAVLVEREKKIKGFQPKDYWEIEATFQFGEGHEYVGGWFDPTFSKKDAKEDGKEDAKANRIWSLEQAEQIYQDCVGKTAHVEENSKTTRQNAPLLFDLTSLQREANARFGFSAKMTLSIAQSLYEKRKVLTYPRTDSRALPQDYISTVKAIIEQLASTPLSVLNHDPETYQNAAKDILHRKGIEGKNRRIFNDQKISDHFAIIPTLSLPKTLSETESKIYDLVLKRFLAIFFPAAEFLVTTRISKVETHSFKTEGKVIVKPGWKAVYGIEIAEKGDMPILQALGQCDQAITRALEIKALSTTPPARYSEATLLSAMEGAGKRVDDDDLRAAMSQKGLGTPATRASIIEGLLLEEYLYREGKELIPTPKAFSLLTLLQGLSVKELASPELTGEWEYKLAQIERGEIKREDFMRDIVQMTEHIVMQAKNYDSDTVPGDYEVVQVPCPNCGGMIKENYKKFQCQECAYSLWKIVAGRQFEHHEIEQLLQERKIGPLTGFRSKRGIRFQASISLNEENEPEFVFDEAEQLQKSPPPDLSNEEILGACPKCGEPVYEYRDYYLCRQYFEKICDFRSSRVILQREVPRTQMQKLLKDGRTELIDKFISRKGREFSAYLVKTEEGKLGFEFEPRKSKAKSNKAIK